MGVGSVDQANGSFETSKELKGRFVPVFVRQALFDELDYFNFIAVEPAKK